MEQTQDSYTNIRKFYNLIEEYYWFIQMPSTMRRFHDRDKHLSELAKKEIGFIYGEGTFEELITYTKYPRIKIRLRDLSLKESKHGINREFSGFLYLSTIGHSETFSIEDGKKYKDNLSDFDSEYIRKSAGFAYGSYKKLSEASPNGQKLQIEFSIDKAYINQLKVGDVISFRGYASFDNYNKQTFLPNVICEYEPICVYFHDEDISKSVQVSQGVAINLPKKENKQISILSHGEKDKKVIEEKKNGFGQTLKKLAVWLWEFLWVGGVSLLIVLVIIAAIKKSLG